MTLHLYDTKTSSRVELRPVTPGHVGIYLCGPTVQGAPHIGHLRSAVSFDILIRWLHLNGLDVTYIRNITDIDDKILTKSREGGVQWWAWAARFEREFDRAYRLLGVLPPTFEPRATAHIPDQIALVERLIEQGHAYPDGNGNVYFNVRSQDDYGSLTHQKLDDMLTTEDPTHIDSVIEAGKADPRDFALWKTRKPGEPNSASWDSPWGKGRPGWHLECSAMSQRYLGDSFDIHGGGIDLRFPHHENEQAQSHGAGWGFAQLWMHNAWVTIKGEKMAKSVGNVLSVDALSQQASPAAIRWAMSTVHYRSAIEWGEETLPQAQAAWDKFSTFILKSAEICGQATDDEVAAVSVQDLPKEFVEALDDDLNVAGAMAVLYEHLREGNTLLMQHNAGQESVVEKLRYEHILIRSMLNIFGLDPLAEQWRGQGGADMRSNLSDTDAGMTPQMYALHTLVNAILEQRRQAREEKNWGQADVLRNQLSDAGIIVEDSAQGPSWHVS